MNETEDPDVSHNVPSSDLLKGQANSKGEDESDALGSPMSRTGIRQGLKEKVLKTMIEL